MKIIIVGAGGVGAYYGALLSKAGNDVFFIARGAHLEAISEQGLCVKSINGDLTITPPCGSNGDDFGIADLILVCVKAHDTQCTFGLYRGNIGPDTTIISLQNGIDNEQTIAQELGQAHVLGGVAFIGSCLEAPGLIHHTAFGHMAIGEITGGISERTKAIGDVFSNAGIKCKISKSITLDIWGKTLWNIGFNAICAILSTDAKSAAQNEHTRTIIHRAMSEWIEIAQAKGINLTPAMADKNIEITLKGGKVIPSMVVDKQHNRKTEIDIFNGKAVELGAQTGIDTPVNNALASIVRFWESRL